MSGMHRNRVKRQSRIRLAIQLAAAAMVNGYAAGFAKGKIFTGSAKGICVPVLNCYSCPGALGSCPIGALQAVAGGVKHNFSFYVLGTIMLFGIILGRFFCGFLCPFGLLQDLLYRIPVKKIKVPAKIDRPARYIKYAVVLFLVLLLPGILTNEYGIGSPYFCQLVCPAGTLEGGIPLLLTNAGLRERAAFLFGWKLLLLLITIIAAVLISRFFCKYFCPLGALYSLFNKFSFYQMSLDKAKCIDCGACEENCPMSVEVRRDINHRECIRCGRCKAGCPQNAIVSGLGKS